MARKTQNWLHSWMELSSGWEAPERYKLWAGVTSIASALARRVWVHVKRQDLFPNLYVILVGKPGLGKGNAMKFLAAWLKEMDGVNMAPDSLTKRSFYNALEAAIVTEGGIDNIHHSLSAFIEELGVFLHAGDLDFIYSICHVYDCPGKFIHKTAHSGENDVQNVCFNMLSAATPKALRDIFSEDAMELGISARTILIFADSAKQVDIFNAEKPSEKLIKDIKFDLHLMTKINGEYIFEEEAALELVKWSKLGFAPIPKDPRFEHYNGRRFVHIGKLCMIMAAARSNNLVITAGDVHAAKTILLEAEGVMPGAIETLGANPMLIQQNIALKLITTTWDRLERGTPESEIYKALARDGSPQYMRYLIEFLTNTKWVYATGSAPDRIFYPHGKKKKPKSSIDKPQ